MPLPYQIRNARGPSQGTNYHSYCLDCHRVIYSLHTHGPMTPYEHNKTFCVCNGKETGEIALKVTVYDLEDVLSPEDAATERARQKGANDKPRSTRTTK